MELWVAYETIWESIQKNYKATAPKMLSSMGYEGAVSIYLGQDRLLTLN